MNTPTSLFRPARLLPLVALLLGLIAPQVLAQPQQLEINVRTNIIDKSIIWAGKAPAPDSGGHSKVYGILSVQEVKAEQKLIKKVDEGMVMELLSQELNRNGFQLYAPGTKPEIVITVSYGRGELANPYIKGVGVQGGNGDVGAFTAGANISPAGNQFNGAGLALGGGPSANDTGVTSVTITGAAPQQLFDEKTPGFEAKLQKAATEKLYIRVVAWAYPSDPKAKSKMLWKTTMVVDDPDHRDLNKIAAAMLEAGAPYFDKQIREREADVYKPIPDGKVKVGAPEVVPFK